MGGGEQQQCDADEAQGLEGGRSRGGCMKEHVSKNVNHFTRRCVGGVEMSAK